MSLIATDTPSDAVAAVPPVSPAAGEAVRYLAASVAALTVDALLLWVGVEAVGVAPWLAGAVSYAAGLVLVYQLSIRWVFARRAMRSTRGEFAVFAVLGLFGLALNSATLYVATDLGMALAWAKALSAGIGFVANFVSRKLLLFSVRKA
jgi:putative flippase GtrA